MEINGEDCVVGKKAEEEQESRGTGGEISDLAAAAATPVANLRLRPQSPFSSLQSFRIQMRDTNGEMLLPRSDGDDDGAQHNMRTSGYQARVHPARSSFDMLMNKFRLHRRYQKSQSCNRYIHDQRIDIHDGPMN